MLQPDAQDVSTLQHALQALLETAGACLEPPCLQGGAGGSVNGSTAATVPLRVGRYRQVVSHMLKANFG